MEIQIKDKDELVKLASSFGIVIHTKREEYMYLPFWIKTKNDGSKTLVRFENLPDEVRQMIELMENDLKTPIEVLGLYVDAEEVKGDS
jgi:adenylosuccinate synthase